MPSNGMASEHITLGFHAQHKNVTPGVNKKRIVLFRNPYVKEGIMLLTPC